MEGHTTVGQTFVLIKPDAVQRRLVGEIVSRFERQGFVVRRMDSRRLAEADVAEHYPHLANEPFFPEIVAYMTSGPVVGMVLEAPNAVQAARRIVGATDPMKAERGSIRGDLATSIRYNLVHAADSESAARMEIGRFFSGAGDERNEGCR
ncbi:MAG: nucleoside-diphosphate kinase [Firmicutes bacterium]|jgi:nucleoside-diphosphate kinase|nr:nucleoside-diphosphate kinase [Bacillota bacterium]